MASLVKNFLIGFFLLAFSTILPHGFMAQAADRDIDAKIKRLEQFEAKVDVKLKKLENLEARLEARLEPEVQPVVARAGSDSPDRPLPVAPSSASGCPQPSQRWCDAHSGRSDRHAMGTPTEAVKCTSREDPVVPVRRNSLAA